MNKLLGWFITINLVNIFWVFFRAETLSGAVKVLKGMVDVKGLIYIGTHIGHIREMIELYRDLSWGILGTKFNLVSLLLSMMIVFLLKNTINLNKNFRFGNFNMFKIVNYFGFALVYMFILKLSNIDSTFLYFNF